MLTYVCVRSASRQRLFRDVCVRSASRQRLFRALHPNGDVFTIRAFEGWSGSPQNRLAILWGRSAQNFVSALVVDAHVRLCTLPRRGARRTLQKPLVRAAFTLPLRARSFSPLSRTLICSALDSHINSFGDGFARRSAKLAQRAFAPALASRGAFSRVPSNAVNLKRHGL